MATDRTTVQAGAALPASCAVGDLFVKTTAPVGLHVCEAANVWTPYTLDGVWDDASTLTPAAINPIGPDGNMTVIDAAPPAYIGLLQADATGESCVVSWQLNHRYKLGTDIKPHIHIVRNDGAANTGTCSFEAKFRHLPLRGTASAWTNFEAGDQTLKPADGADKSGLIAWTLADATYHFSISDIVLAVIKRVNVGGGGETGSLAVASSDIHTQTGRFGSVGEGSLP